MLILRLDVAKEELRLELAGPHVSLRDTRRKCGADPLSVMQQINHLVLQGLEVRRIHHLMTKAS